jgi:hypothetical protein
MPAAQMRRFAPEGWQFPHIVRSGPWRACAIRACKSATPWQSSTVRGLATGGGSVEAGRRERRWSFVGDGMKNVTDDDGAWIQAAPSR